MQANIGVAGEFRCVVKRADGSIKTDTGYQKNLILNQGLDFFGGSNGTYIMNYCVIGSGNSTPTPTQTMLDSTIKGVTGNGYSTKGDYNQATDGNLYKTNKVSKYSFTALNNVNISEVGLASLYSTPTSYYLCTRALIKDSNGNPTTITVLSGEQLDIYYKIWIVYDTTDKTGVINLLDGVGGSAPYNYKVRLSEVGTASFTNSIGNVLNGGNYKYLYNGDLGSLTSYPSGTLLASGTNNDTLSTYVIGSYKRTLTYSLQTSTGNGSIRAYRLAIMSFSVQIRFGSVANDSPIVKNDTQTLTLPVEISWGRYEGAL